MYKVMKAFMGTGCTRVDIGVKANLELVDKFCYLGDMLSVDGDGDAAVENRIRIGCNKFRQLVLFLIIKYLKVRGRLYSGCTVYCMEVRPPISKENQVALQQAERRWMWREATR